MGHLIPAGTGFAGQRRVEIVRHLEEETKKGKLPEQPETDEVIIEEKNI